jgi:amidase
VVATWVGLTLDYWSRRTGQPIRPDSVEPNTWALAEMGRAVSATQYLATVDWLHGYTRRMAGWWADGFDLLVTPTLGAPPPRLGELTPTRDEPLSAMERVAALIPFTPAFNITGQPAISLPLASSAEGLPVGVQLVAAYGREDVLIRVAAQLEQERPWAARRPPVHA